MMFRKVFYCFLLCWKSFRCEQNCSMRSDIQTNRQTERQAGEHIRHS